MGAALTFRYRLRARHVIGGTSAIRPRQEVQNHNRESTP
jgi:hypothetical protein